MNIEEMQAQLEQVLKQNAQLQAQIKTTEFKKVGMFGSTSNAIKATAASLETVASGINQAAAIGLLKIQIEGMESAKEAGFECGSLTEYQALMQESLAIARLAYK